MKLLRRLTIALAILIVLAGLGAFLENLSFSKALGTARNDTVTLIKPGAGVSAIAQQLQNEHLISNALLFRIGLRLHRAGQTLKAGEYAIPARATMAQIADILISGKSIQHKLTVAEGLTSDMVWKLVKAEPALSGDAGPVPVEGSLLPDTYLFTRGTTRAELIARMKKGQEDLLAKLWPGRDQDLPYSTQMQAVILASIVEKETGVASERPQVASVFANRLRIGMRLQSDPTIIYGITKGYPLGRRIRQSEIDAVTPYNTYAIPGLPQSPIANPGRDAIAAVLKPAKTSYLYFVANGTGGHVFASTMVEQEKNVAAWRRFREQTGK
jgi:UPF0755 protein